MRINRSRNGQAATIAAGVEHAHRLQHETSPGAWEPLAARIAGTDCAVLIIGETGSGKGYAARWVHERSSRASKPLVPVNCGAIPEAIIDSQLFGHARGAFSGAEREHQGMVRAANGGTLLLDEIADLPLASQARLLRLLEEREVQPVGHSQPVKVNVRVIAATSADLRERVRHGFFREDLLFRLDVVRLHMPPLRERRSEIPTLLNRFNNELASIYRQPALRFDADAMRMIESHGWPGNVRELRTVIERLHVMLGGRQDCSVSQRDMAMHGGVTIGLHESSRRIAAADRIAELKIDAVNEALTSSDGNMKRAADILGVHRSTLYRWLDARNRISA